MKIGKVTGSNFLALGSVEFNLSDQGLVHIYGDNRDDSAADSNGAGKSSVVDLVMWILFGETARGVSGGEVIRSGQSEAFGSMELIDDDGTTYQIERSRLKSKENLKFQQGAVILTKGTTKLTEAEIARVLGSTKEIFLGAVYAGQEALIDLPAMTDKMLKLTIEQASGIEVLERAYARARKMLLEATQQQSAAKSNLDAATRQTQATLSYLEDARKLSVDWEDARTLGQQREEANIKAMEAEVEDIDTQLSTMPEESALRAALTKLNDSVSGNADLEKHRMVLASQLSALSTNHGIAERDLKLARQEMARQENELKTVNDRVGKPCSECGTIMDENHVHNSVEVIEDRLLKAEESVRKCTREVKKASDACDAKRTELETHSASIPDISDVTAKISKIHTAISARTAVESKKKAIEARIHSARTATPPVNPHTASIKTFESRCNDNEAEELNAANKLAEADTKVEELKTVVEVFGPSGVRAQILDEITPFLNQRTSDYLGHMTDGSISALWSTLTPNSKGELKEKFSIDIDHVDGTRSFRALSGGEKRKVRVSCALALQDLVASRVTKPIQLFIADEVDTALDPSGLERLMGAFTERAQECGTVIVISHTDLRAHIPNAWVVCKEGGKSSLSTH